MNNDAPGVGQNPAILACTLGESLLQIRDQVAGVFEADRDPNGSGTNACRGEFAGAHFVMRTVNGQDHEGFDTAEAGGKKK